jgi:release factor glutamine methyltransferase
MELVESCDSGMPSIAESLINAESVLAESGVAEPRREAMSLLMLAIKKDKAFIYARPEHPLAPEEVELLRAYLERRASREPLQYISGVQEFYGLEFEVTPDVLIPRPETEMVVERAIDILRLSGGGSVCDVGTGSGCIVISILHELLQARGVGLDISRDALQVARRNAEKHGPSERLELLESDLFSVLTDQKFDLIVSNPPYVPVRDMAGLQAEVRDFEPHGALTDGSDGLSIVRRIIHDAPQFLVHNGHLILEIGFDQSEKVIAMFDPAVWFPPELYPDLQGIPRLVSARMI